MFLRVMVFIIHVLECVFRSVWKRRVLVKWQPKKKPLDCDRHDSNWKKKNQNATSKNIGSKKVPKVFPS